MAPHSSTLARKIPWMEEPGGLQSMGSLRVRHYQATSLPLFHFMHWRRKWQPTPVFLPGESQGQGSLVGGHLWGLTMSDMTGATQQQLAAAGEKNDTYQFKKPSFFKYLRKRYPNQTSTKGTYLNIIMATQTKPWLSPTVAKSQKRKHTAL